MDKGWEKRLKTIRKKAEDSLKDSPLAIDQLSPREIKSLVHELRAHKMEMQMLNETLQESEAWWSILADGLPDMLFALDLDLRIRYINHSPPGLDKETLPGTFFYLMETKEEQGNLKKLLKKTISKGGPATYELTFHPGEEGNNKTRCFECSIVPRIREDNITGLTVSARDITHRKLEEKKRLEAETRVQQIEKFESLNIMAGSIAHNFNNILMGVLGNLELALSMLPSEAPGKLNIERAEMAARRATELSRLMLTYVGKNHIEPETVDMGININQLLNVLRAPLPENIELKFSPPEESILFTGDPVQFRQIVMHLVNNGIEALGKEGGAVTINIGSRYCRRQFLSNLLMGEKIPEGEYACLEVVDNGCGMDDQTIKRIFDPFFTTKFLGRGLGLPAALGIVRAHQGAISIKSRFRKGTTVKVFLPVGDLVPKTGTLPDALFTAKETGEDACPECPDANLVLLADDEEIVLEVGKAMLEQLGYNVITATDGTEAVEMFKEHHDQLSCVVLDLSMPILNGAAAVHQMRQIRDDVPMMLTSGYPEEELDQHFQNLPRVPFLEKPFHLSKLKNKLDKVLVSTANE